MSASAERVSSGERETNLRDGPIPLGETAASQPVDQICTTLAIAGIAFLAIRRWMLVGPYPPGLDGAQWLALGRGLDGQAIGRSTEGAYAPLAPVLAAIIESITGPLLAVRLLAAASGLAVSFSIWFVARSALGPVWGLAVTAIVIPASALAEPALFGGYPQQFALAAGLVALWAVCQYLTRNSGTGFSQRQETPNVPPSPAPTGRVPSGSQGSGVRPACDNAQSLWLAGIAALITSIAHHIYFPIITLAILAAIGLWLTDRPPVKNPARVIGLLPLTLTPACALFAAVAFAFMRAGYAAPLDASSRSFVDAWKYGTRESPALWFVILASGIIGLAVHRRKRGDGAWLLAASLVVPAGLLFLVSGQPRLLPPILIGAGIAAGLCAKLVASIGPQVHAAALLLALTIAATLFVPADRATAQYTDFYRVVDESLMRAATAIESDAGSGAVAVREDRRGWPIGWWFEALLDRPVIVGSDPRWLAFPAERENARLAGALFDGLLDPGAFRQRAAVSGIRYLVVAKWDWIGWERWLTTPGFPVAKLYDDDRYLVLRVT
jgi:hypothetical protein